MALFNEIQVGRFNAVLHKLFDMKEGAPSPQVASEIMPVITLESDRPEWAFLANERLCYGGSAQNAVAGELSHIQLLNRSSDALVVVKEIRVQSPGGATFLTIGNVDAVFPGASVQLSSGFTDSRLSRTANRTAAQIWRQTNAASLLDNALYNFYSDGYHRLTFPIVLTANRGIGVRTTSVNEILGVQFVWTERFIEDSETR